MSAYISFVATTELCEKPKSMTLWLAFNCEVIALLRSTTPWAMDSLIVKFPRFNVSGQNCAG